MLVHTDSMSISMTLTHHALFFFLSVLRFKHLVDASKRLLYIQFILIVQLLFCIFCLLLLMPLQYTMH